MRIRSPRLCYSSRDCWRCGLIIGPDDHLTNTNPLREKHDNFDLEKVLTFKTYCGTKGPGFTDDKVLNRQDISISTSINEESNPTVQSELRPPRTSHCGEANLQLFRQRNEYTNF